MNKSLLLASAAALAPFAAQAIVVDNFSSAGLSEYTQLRVLEGTAASVAEQNVSFSDASGALVASYTGTVNQPEQVLLLRNDFTLQVGWTLRADVSFATQAAQMDFGIAVANALPTAVTSSADLDTRDTTAWAAVYVRPSQNAVRNTTANTATAVTGVGVAGADETTVSQLFIRRTSLTGFELGFLNTSNVETITNTVTLSTFNSLNPQIGFYADLRANGGTLGSLDNLQVIPEPATYAGLAGVTALALAAWRRRRS